MGAGHEQFGGGQPALLAISASQHGVSVEGAADGMAEKVEFSVRRMLQLDLPIAEFHAFCGNHPKLGHVPAARQGRLLRSPTLFEDYLKIVCKVRSGVATWSAVEREPAAN